MVEMKIPVLLFIIFSAFLFSCGNEHTGNSSPEKEVSPQIQEASDESKAEKRATIEDTIEVFHPRSGEVVSSPLQIKGRARGFWFFEASFAIRLLDKSGKEIAVVPAEAQEDWMTEEWVLFEATLEFDPANLEEGVLIFEKANPSGLEEHARELRVELKI